MTETLVQSWLTLQCRMIPDVARAFTALDVDGGEAVTPTACWPDQAAATPALIDIARKAMARRQPVMRKHASSEGEGAVEVIDIAAPLHCGGRVQGVIALEIPRLTEAQVRAVMQLVQWGSAWLELLIGKAGAGGSDTMLVHHLTALCLRHDPFQAAATAAVTALAEHLGCDRVSCGMARGGRIRMEALSGSASFDARSNLIVAIEAAMTESLAAGRTLHVPADASDGIHAPASPAHRQLSEHGHDESVCTVPLRHAGESAGALVLERAADRPFSAVEIETLQAAADLLGPILKLKYDQERTLRGLAVDRAVRQLRRLSEPARRRSALTIGAVTMAALLLLFATGEFRVSAPVTLEGTIQRAAVVPYDGYVAAEHVRAGATVTTGQVMAELDDSDLRLERRNRLGEKDKLEKQYRKALADLDQAEARILRAQIEQADARLALLDEQLARTRITAPFDGVVIAGDLSRSLGAPVQRGDVLFEIAPLDGYRVVLEVDERDVPELAVGQTGRLTLSAMPGDRLPFIVTNIATIAADTPERTAFRVEADLEAPGATLRPGMQGIGKISIDRRSRIWIWTRRLVGWLQLTAWSYLP
ncbi:MAG: HlyD family efflux transporter periplasmic adaptor subunit [Gammaproteobacteria bacterium]|nr:HlyD family efflux transporter periplasmic adaptor subunit [Gammaproteobacteria bacterium]